MARTSSQEAARVLTEDELTDLMFKALAAKPRREILTLLSTGAGESDDRCCSPDEVCACVFSERLGLGAPTVSHHMKVLVEAHLISSEKRGQWVYYRLRLDAIGRLVNALTNLTNCNGGTCR